MIPFFLFFCLFTAKISAQTTPNLVLLDGINPNGQYNDGDQINIIARFDDFLSPLNSSMTVEFNTGPTTPTLDLTLSSTSIIDETFGIVNTPNSAGGGGSVGIVMATELKFGVNAGRIALAGDFDQYEGSATAGLVILNEDGSVFQTFSRTTATGIGTADVHSVFETSQGKLLVGGQFQNVYGDLNYDYLIQLQPDVTTGLFSIDTAFMNNLTRIGNGTATRAFNGPIGSSGPANSASYYSANTPVIEDASGNIYIGGDFSVVGGFTTNHLIVLNPDGTRNTSFTSPFTNAAGRIMSLAFDDLDNDGTADRLWAVGLDMTINTSYYREIWLLNLSNGSADTSFDNTLINGTVIGGIVVLPEIADGGVGGIAISGRYLSRTAHVARNSITGVTSSVPALTGRPLYVLNNDGTQNTAWTTQADEFLVAGQPWSGEGFQVVKNKLFFGMHYVNNDLSASEINDPYYQNLDFGSGCAATSATDNCGLAPLMVFNLDDGTINGDFMDVINARGSFVEGGQDDIHDFELLTDGGLLLVGDFANYRDVPTEQDQKDIIKFRFDQLTGTYTVRDNTLDLTSHMRSIGITAYSAGDIFGDYPIDTDGSAAYTNLMNTDQEFHDNTLYGLNTPPGTISLAVLGTSFSVEDGLALATGTDTETLTIQLKDSGGNNLFLNDVLIELNVSGSAVFNADGSSTLSNGNQTITGVTDINGQFTATIDDTTVEIVNGTANIDTDYNNISDGNPANQVQVTFRLLTVSTNRGITYRVNKS